MLNPTDENVDQSLSVKERMKRLSCCVIIPTYNNVSSISQVVDDVSNYCSDIFVVLDGPTDGTAELIREIKGIQVIDYTPNRGKGFALRKGFKAARKEGFENAIALDSDGQHYAKDILTLLEKSEEVPGSLIVGARKMEGADQNKKSGFANKFSNFWYKIETLHSLPDTQSGYRLYPIGKMKGMLFLSTKYEFEVEVLVKAVWRGIKVTSTPIDVYYPPQSERVSHFRPGPDFTRISFLNTYLVLSAVLYGHWLVIFRALTWKNIKWFIKKNFFDQDEPISKKALSVGWGVFMGIFPAWGFQMLLCGILAHFFKLNKAISVLSSNISSPPFLPLIIYGSYKAGQWVLPSENNVPLDLDLIESDPARFLMDSSLQYFTGSVIFGIIGAAVATGISYCIFYLYQRASINISGDKKN
jgi:glycosyltransferase involved in cell wall biosynthesis